MLKTIRLTPEDVKHFVDVASKCDFDIDICYNRYVIDAKSFLGVEWFPTILREPLSASDTLSEATAPVKLPTRHCPPARSWLQVRNPVLQGWYPNIDSVTTGVITSSSPTYPVHAIPNPSIKLE